MKKVDALLSSTAPNLSQNLNLTPLLAWVLRGSFTHHNHFAFRAKKALLNSFAKNEAKLTVKIVLDTSIFVSFLNDQDIFHKHTRRMLEKLMGEKELEIIIPVLVFLEVANVLFKTLGTFDETILLGIFQHHELVDIDYDVTQKLLPVLKEVKLKTSDAIIVGIANLTGAQLLTWDEKIQSQAKEIVAVLYPDSLV